MKPSRAKRKVYKKQVRETELKLLNSQMDYNNERRARFMAEQLSKDLYDKIRYYEEVFNDAIACLGKNHPSFKPMMLDLGRQNPWVSDYIEMCGRPENELIGPITIPVQSAAIITHRLTVMATDAQRSEFSGQLHIRVKFGDQRFGYAISDAAWRSAPKHVLMRRISEELGYQIVKERTV